MAFNAAADVARIIASLVEDGNEFICTQCAMGGDLVCCDGCPKAFHIDCVPALMRDGVPDGDWFCPSCDAAQGAEGEEESEEDEGEAKARVVLVTSTSSQTSRDRFSTSASTNGGDGAFASTAAETELLMNLGRARDGGDRAASAASSNSHSAVPLAVSRHPLVLLDAGRNAGNSDGMTAAGMMHEHSFESAEIDDRRGGSTGGSDIPFAIVPARPAEAVLEYAGAAYAKLLSEHDAFTPGVWERGELSSSGDERGDVDAVPAAKSWCEIE